MKKTGIIILLIGFVFTIFSTFKLLLAEHVTDPGQMKIAQVKIHNRVWQPLLGAMVVIAGMGIYSVGRSKALKSNVKHSTGIL